MCLSLLFNVKTVDLRYVGKETELNNLAFLNLQKLSTA